MPGHRAQQDGAIADRPAERSRLVERRREGDDPPARATAISRLQPDNAAKGRRLTNRATGIGPDRTGTEAGCHRSRRTSRRTAWNELGRRTAPPPGRYDWTIAGRLIGRTHGEFVGIGLAEQHRAVTP